MAPKDVCNLNLVVNLAFDIWLSWILIMKCQHWSKIAIVFHGKRLEAKLWKWGGGRDWVSYLMTYGSTTYDLWVLWVRCFWLMSLMGRLSLCLINSRCKNSYSPEIYWSMVYWWNQHKSTMLRWWTFSKPPHALIVQYSTVEMVNKGLAMALFWCMNPRWHILPWQFPF